MTLTNEEAGALALFALLSGTALLVIALIYYIVRVIAQWRIFKKAGEPGWKSLIPIYAEYVLCKIVWNTNYFIKVVIVALIMGVCNYLLPQDGATSYTTVQYIAAVIDLVAAIYVLVLHFKFSMRYARAYGKGTGFGIGLFFLPHIFQLILGLGASEYVGNQAD